MPLFEEFQRQGNWIFRRRSYLPFLAIPLVIVAFREFSYPFGSPRLDKVWEFVCLVVSFSGIAIRAVTAGCAPRRTSGRNTKKGQVADSLNTTGMYSVLRHPLYLGNLFAALGPVLFLRSWWFLLIFLPTFWLYYERVIFAEEEFLRRRFGQRYLDWASRTPAFVPDPRKWRPSHLRFSVRTVLKREYQTVLLLVIVMTCLEMASDYVVEGKIVLDALWAAIFSAGLLFFVVVRFLHKKTRMLHVAGR